MDRDMDLFDSLPVERLLPIYRNPNSYLDSHHYSPGIRPRTGMDRYARSSYSATSSALRNHRSRDAYRSNLLDMDDKIRDMQRNMDVMCSDFDHVAEPSSLLSLMPRSNFGNFGASRSEVAKIENPVIKDMDGKKKLYLEFDVKHFKPEEISVRTKDRFLEIHAKHEDKSETGTAYREYRRVFNVPNEVDPEALKSELSPDGVLIIQAEVQAAIQAANEPMKIAIKHD